MDNSEIPPPPTGILEVVHKERDDLDNSQKPKPGSSSRSKRNRVWTANKEGRKETTGISVEDPESKDLYLAILKDLQAHHFIVQADVKLKGSFFCELCEVKLGNIEECQNHVIKKSHKKLKKTKGEHLALSQVSYPSEPQILALSRLLESVVLEHGLCPVKDLPMRQEVTKDVSRTVCSNHPECSVSVYGSSLTGFGLKDSDINLDLVIPDEVNIPPVLLSILDLLQNDGWTDGASPNGVRLGESQLSEKINLPFGGLDCELSPGNGTASSTSRLLKMYSDLDPRVRTLVSGLQYWGRLCGVDCQSEGGLPGYSLALMVIQFLQEAKPPVLPRWTPTEVVDKANSSSLEDFITENKEETGSLWFQLFRFYCLDFDIPSLVISIKEPVPLKRAAKKWGHRRIAVEDPFSTKRNVASSMSSDKAFEYFFSCWKTSYYYFGSLPSCPQAKPAADISNGSPTNCTKKTDKMKQKTDVVVEEEAIFEIDDADQATKEQQSLELLSHDGIKLKGVSEKPTEKDSPNLESKTDESHTDEEVEVTLCESDSDEASESQNQSAEGKDGHSDSEKQGCLNTEAVNKTTVIDVPQIEFRFDAQVFRGKNRPVKTCCYCKEDGHIKTQCPDLRKPPLKPLPPMTQQFVDVLDFACRTCRADFEMDRSEVGYREKVLRNLEDYIHEVFPGARLFLFGSSKNGFGFRNSDIDICMTLDDMAKEEVDAVDVITKLAKLLRKHKDCGNVLAITTAKVPIVKFYLRSCKREADISLYNTLALENTAMLATYAKLDDRVTTLGCTVKVFAKVCDIGDASKGSLSSYAYILMLLHYLQQCNPPVIPVLQSLYTDSKKPEKFIDGWNCWFCKDLKTIKNLWNQKQKNPLSAGMLWYGFLRYYTEQFDFEHDVVCCRRTKKLTKFEKMWTKHVFAIEDPFNLDHNLGAGVTRKMASYIMSTFINGRELFGFPRYDIPPQICQQYFFDVYFLTDGYEAPTDRNCRVCGRIGHIAKDCPHSKSNRRAELKKEEEERKAAKENGEILDASRKPFSAGPTRPRSVSAPNKQEQKMGPESSASLPTSQRNNTPARQEASVKSLSRSQADTNIDASALTQKRDVKGNENSAENSPGVASSHVQTPQMTLVNKDILVTGLKSEMIDADRNLAQQPVLVALSASVATETATHAGDSSGKQVNEAESGNELKGNQDNKSSSTALPTSSTVPRPHSQSAPTILDYPPGINPPLGFIIPGNPSQAPHAALTGSTHGLVGSMSPQVSKSPAERPDGQPVIFNTPPRHQPFMFSPLTGYFVGSPSQHKMWLRQQGLIHPSSPPLRPLVPYPLTPEAQAPLQHWNVVSDSLAMQHFDSLIRGQQHRTEHNEQLVFDSPPNISRNVMWPVGRPSPPPAAGGQQNQEKQLPFPHVSAPGLPTPTMRSPQHMNHPHLSCASSPGVPGSLQQIGQQLQVAHSPGMPPPVCGSPPQHALQHSVPRQEGHLQPPFGTHMTGEQFMNFMRMVEDESKKQESTLATKVSSNQFEPKELKDVAPKDLKMAETPEEHKLLSKLSKVKSLWEESPPLGPERSCSKQDSTVNCSFNEESDEGQSSSEAQLPTKREAWGPGPDVQMESDEIKSVGAEHKEREEVVPDEKMQATSCTSDKNYQQTKVKQQTTGTMPKEVQKQKPTRRGGRGRKRKNSRHSESDINAVQKLEEKVLEDEQRKTKGNRQHGHDERKNDDVTVETSPKKGSSAVENGKEQIVEGSCELKPQQSHKKKNSPSSFKDNDMLRPERSQQEARTADGNSSLRNFAEGVKEAAPKQENATSAKDGGKKGQERSLQGIRTTDSGNPHGSASGEGEDGASKRKGVPASARNGVKQGSEGNSQGARRADSGDSRSCKGGTEGSPKQKYSPTSKYGGDRKGPGVSSQGVRSADSGDSPISYQKGGKAGSPKQKRSPTSAKNGDKKGSEGSSKGARTADSGDSPVSSHKGGKGVSRERKGSATSAKGGNKKGSEGSSQGLRTADYGDSFGGSSKGAKGGSPKQKGSPTSAKNGDKKGSEGSLQDVRTADSGGSSGGSSKGVKDGSPGQKDSPTKTNDRHNKGSEGSSQCVRTADSPISSGSASKGAKGGTPNQSNSPTSTNDRSAKGHEKSQQFERAGNFGYSPRDSSKGGQGRASNRWRRRPHSRTNSEGKGGENKVSRNRSNSAPDKHPSKNS